ncbi:cupin [Brevibacillus porteri]|uniref:Cupin n=1 Tax=Brevibacillus porteri TaxID=2126350 RepID=A0ABX5FHF9_9BACL|nr:cupin [Brevibacillus porteri]MED1802926.1 cupin [Brevibacillus porteri]MED2135102.1 cupin [Brevibacillus porteri]MED2746344.1 cupin [Brevibacillus porteri]MED2817928.1 cupin [Brevibacillus porteri]MED2895560.1 cupin [Brevibacillus porteri]
MELYRFDKEIGKRITKFNSDFIMSRIIQTEKIAHIGCMHLEANGIIGYHQAVVPQLLLIMVGEGYVRGEKNEYFKVEAGDAVFWEKDEWHETKTTIGLIAIVIESEELTPSSFMTFKEASSVKPF